MSSALLRFATISLTSLVIAACGAPENVPEDVLAEASEATDATETPETPMAPDATPGFTDAQNAFVAAHMAEVEGQPISLDRLKTTPSGLSPMEMMSVLAHPGLKDRALEVMADYTTPEGSMYFDAIYGPQYGQRNIRNWLIPVMAEIPFVEFRPTQETHLFDDGQGGTMIDEWVMIAKLGGQEIPMGDGVSIRRFRDGWMHQAIDVYDTAPSRTPPPPGTMPPLPEGVPEPAPLPDYPEMNFPAVEVPEPAALSEAAQAWVDARMAVHAAGGDIPDSDTSGLSHDDIVAIHDHPEYGMNFNLVADLMHPTDSVYIDPIFGTFKGQKEIRVWLTDIMGKVGSIAFEPIAQPQWDGDVLLHMWRQMAVLPDGEKVEMVWGASVRRLKDGWIVWAADYFDTAGMQRPAVMDAAAKIGSSVTLEDVMRYRNRGTAPQ